MKPVKKVLNENIGFSTDEITSWFKKRIFEYYEEKCLKYYLLLHNIRYYKISHIPIYTMINPTISIIIIILF